MDRNGIKVELGIASAPSHGQVNTSSEGAIPFESSRLMLNFRVQSVLLPCYHDCEIIADRYNARMPPLPSQQIE